jgi:ankyrin repeat protein
MADLHSAYHQSGASGLREALKRGADPNAADRLGAPLLCDVAAAGDLEAIRLLLDAGAEIDASGDEGWTPLICAANAGHVAAVRLLLDRGADRRAVTDEGYTARDRVSSTNTELLQLLQPEDPERSDPR